MITNTFVILTATISLQFKENRRLSKANNIIAYINDYIYRYKASDNTFAIIRVA